MRLFAKLPHDDEGAKLMRFENVRGQRYTEIFLIGGHAITHHLVAGVTTAMITMYVPAGGLRPVIQLPPAGLVIPAGLQTTCLSRCRQR